LALYIIVSPDAFAAKVNPSGKLFELRNSAGHLRAKNMGDEKAGYIPVIIKLENASDNLPSYAHELRRRGALVLANVEADHIDDLAGLNFVTRVEASVSAVPTLDKAKDFCSIRDIRPSTQNPTGLTGKGVVTGFCDIGFQPAHVNFLDSDGNSRVKKIVHYSTDSPTPVVLESADGIAAWSTDTPDETHATHVAGIMSGSYDADGLDGIATEADIVATTSPLYEAYLLDGCEQIMEYAAQQEKPAVINMSISNEIGPHDGTTLFNQYMRQLAREVPVCISSGNSGNRPGYIRHTTTASNPTFRTYAREWTHWSPLEAQGVIDIWSADATMFSLNVVGWNMNSKEMDSRWEYSAQMREDGSMPELIICSRDHAADFPGHHPVFLPDRISGYIYVTAEHNPENGRYNAFCHIDIKDTTTTDPYAAEMAFGVEVTGADGQDIQVFSTTNIYLNTHGDPLAIYGATDRTINDFCMDEGPICVGSMDSRSTYPLISGETVTYGKLHPGGASYFSSYATTDGGEILPHICAPGATLVSSISTPYILAHPEATAGTSYMHEIDGEKYYWRSEQGTSMSSPFVAGTLALWLQANPDLTPAQLREILITTADTPSVTPRNPQWGRGILNAAEGLKRVMETGGICGVSTSDSTLKITKTAPHIYNIACGSGIVSRVSLHNLSGIKVMELTGNDHTVTIDCTHLPGSIYIVEAEDASGKRHCSKIAVN